MYFWRKRTINIDQYWYTWLFFFWQQYTAIKNSLCNIVLWLNGKKNRPNFQLFNSDQKHLIWLWLWLNMSDRSFYHLMTIPFCLFLCHNFTLGSTLHKMDNSLTDLDNFSIKRVAVMCRKMQVPRMRGRYNPKKKKLPCNAFIPTGILYCTRNNVFFFRSTLHDIGRLFQ